MPKKIKIKIKKKCKGAYVQVLRVQVLVEKEDRVTRYGDGAFVTYQLYSFVIIPPCTSHYGLLPLRF